MTPIPIARRLAGQRGIRPARAASDTVPLAKQSLNSPAKIGRIPPNLSAPYRVQNAGTYSIYYFNRAVWPLTYHQGPVAGSARLQLLFWGDYWNTPAANPSTGTLSDAATTIVNSAYLSELTQYGFSSISLLDPLVVTQPGPSTPTFSFDNVGNMVWDLIDGGSFPEPDEDGGNIIYMVFAPPGAVYDDAKAAGAHSGRKDKQDLLEPDTERAWIGWVDYGTLDQMTFTFSHELIEAITDPEPNTGWHIDGVPSTLEEIGDVGGGMNWMVGGYKVQGYYSARLQAIVVPSDTIYRRLEVVPSYQSVGAEHQIDSGKVTVAPHTPCFSGTYVWTLYGQMERCTVSAQTFSYVQPVVQWIVEGQLIQQGQPPTKIEVPSNNAGDILADFQALPPEIGTAMCWVDPSGALIVDVDAGQPPFPLTVNCTVSDQALQFSFVNRTDTTLLALQGRRRAMDDRFAADLNKCAALRLKEAYTVMVNQNFVPLGPGDPVPPWVGNTIGRYSPSVRNGLLPYFTLAPLVQSANQKLAAQLTSVGNLMAAQTFNQPLRDTKRGH